MLTFDGRFPQVDVASSLSLEERALLDALGESPVHPVLAEAVGAPAGPRQPHGAPVCHVASWTYGRPYLSLSPPTGSDLTLAGWTQLSEEQVAAVEAARARFAPLAARGDAEMNAFFAALAQPDLDAIVRAATDAIDHTDPVLLYIEDELYTNYDRFNNLLPKSGGKAEDRFLLCRLPGLPAAALSPGVRRFLFCMHMLAIAGLRAEEFNGRQFTPWALRAWFGDKRLQYQGLGAGNESSAATRWPPDIGAQAEALRRMKDRLKETHTVYRWVHGVTFRKEERWRPRDPKARSTLDLPAGVKRHCVVNHGVAAEAFGAHASPVEAYFQEVVRRIARVGDPRLRSEALEALLEAVVRSAMLDLPSHLGMTRGMRDLRHFQDALEEGRFDDVCAAPMADGYCAVFARVEPPGFCAPQPLASILTAVSRRMQFNHWHYMPGHFDAKELATRRHFYNPPSMSDLAEEADLQHPGHGFAHVRYAIRSSAPLRVGGRTYNGMVDIRLMRAVGHPYTDADLLVADRYTEIIRCIAQAVLALKGEGLRAPVITGFDRADYERRYPATEETPKPPAIRSTPSMGAMLREAIRQHGQRGAIVCAETGRRYTLADIARVGRRLGEVSAPGETIAVVCANRVHQAVLIAAGLASGRVVCPLDPTLPRRALDTLLQHVRPAAILTDPQAEALLAGLDGAPAEPVGSDTAGLLIYTSGTTGSPKGVLLTERALGANVTFAIEHFGYDADWTGGCILPFHHTFGAASDLLPVLCVGGCVVVAPGFSANNAGAVATAFAAHSVRSYSAVPIILEALLALRVGLPGTLRFVISGASPLTERTRTRYLERFGHPVVACYGLTETVCFAAASPVPGPEGSGKPGAVGRAAGIDIRVLGPDLQPLPRGDTGEIAVRGESVLSGGYYQHGAARDEPFLDDGWFLTGDMGHLDQDAFLYITGRRKNMIIRGGEKLYLEDLDRCLEEHPAVAEACCVQIPGRFGYERAVAFVVAAPAADGAVSADGTGGGSVLEEAIRAHVRASLGADGGPDELVWVSRIPKSATGKPLRFALRGRFGGAS